MNVRLLPLMAGEVEHQTGPESTRSTRGLRLDTPNPKEFILTQNPGDVYAVIIGISDYQDDRIPDLRFAVNDAQEFYNILVDPNYRDIPEDHVKLLLDQEATTRNIKEAIGKWLSDQAKEEDTALIYYAGHGSSEKEESYWVTYEADIDDLYATALNNNEIYDMLNRITSKRVITFLDSCYSAATVKRNDGIRAIPTEIPWEKFSGEGRVTISASDGKQLSLELEKYHHGVFTYYLLEGLKGKADKNLDAIIDLDEIWDYVKYQVTEIAREAGYAQNPKFQGELTAGIPLTFNKPFLEKKQKNQVLQGKKDRIVKLYREGEISVAQFTKALDIIKSGGKDRILEDFLTGKISLELFKETF